VLADFIREESQASQTPHDMAGEICTAVGSTAIARNVRVNPTGNWFEPTNTYFCVIAAPGERKSSVLRNAMQPLRNIEAELIEESKDTISSQQTAFR